MKETIKASWKKSALPKNVLHSFTALSRHYEILRKINERCNGKEINRIEMTL